MDCKGARALALRLQRGDSVSVGALRPRAAVPEGAAPIFHWFGIEPPVLAEDDCTVAPPPAPAEADSRI
jgi:hypothetical protein